MLMVVVGHTPSYRDPSAPSQRSVGYAFVERLLSDALPRTVVMMFFAVSGFLLLFGHDGTLATHRRKLAARTRSLLVPYLVWSAIGIAVYWLLQTWPVTAGWFTNSARRVADRSLPQLLLTWWFDPIPYQLWFLRDLYVMALLSPLLLWLLRRFATWTVAALAVPHVLDYGIPSPVADRLLLTGDTYFWFALGGLFAVRGLPLRGRAALAVPLLLATLAAAAGRAWLLAHATWPVSAPLGSTPDLPWFKLVNALGVATLWVGYDRWLRWLERPFWLRVSAYAFFVFAAHEPLMTMLRKPLVRWLGQGDLRHALQFVLTFAGTVLIVLALGVALRRLLPRTFAFLCGGRG